MKKKSKAIHEPAVEYTRSVAVPTFFGEPMLRGIYAQVEQIDLRLPQLFYSHPNGELRVGEAVTWLRSLADESADLVFADPPYNIKKAEWDTFESQQHYVDCRSFA